MSEWHDISTAPKDGTDIRLKTKGGFVLPAKWSDGFVDSDDRQCACWCSTDDGWHPDSWTDGVCWASNEYGEPSDPPTCWMPLPSPPQTEGGE